MRYFPCDVARAPSAPSFWSLRRPDRATFLNLAVRPHIGSYPEAKIRSAFAIVLLAAVFFRRLARIAFASPISPRHSTASRRISRCLRLRYAFESVSNGVCASLSDLGRGRVRGALSQEEGRSRRRAAAAHSYELQSDSPYGGRWPRAQASRARAAQDRSMGAAESPLREWLRGQAFLPSLPNSEPIRAAPENSPYSPLFRGRPHSVVDVSVGEV